MKWVIECIYLDKSSKSSMNNLSTKTVFPFNYYAAEKTRVVEIFKRSVETLKTRLPAYPLTLLPAPRKHGFTEM